MGRELEWNAEATKIQHKNYVRNSQAITVAWFLFTACYTILNIVVFIQPYWIGDTSNSPGVGYFGLFEWCERTQGLDYVCHGTFVDFNSIKNVWWQASSFLVGLAALLAIFSIIAMLLFLFLKTSLVLNVCGSMQLIAAVSIAIGCIIYPRSFENENVKHICGQNCKGYFLDKCQIQWAYILAIVLIFDAFILAVLAFVLAARQAKMIPETKQLKDGKAQINYGFSDTTDNNQHPAKRQRSIHQQDNYTNINITAAEQSAKIPMDNFYDSVASISSSRSHSAQSDTFNRFKDSRSSSKVSETIMLQEWPKKLVSMSQDTMASASSMFNVSLRGQVPISPRNIGSLVASDAGNADYPSNDPNHDLEPSVLMHDQNIDLEPSVSLHVNPSIDLEPSVSVHVNPSIDLEPSVSVHVNPSIDLEPSVSVHVNPSIDLEPSVSVHVNPSIDLEPSVSVHVNPSIDLEPSVSVDIDDKTDNKTDDLESSVSVHNDPAH